MGLAQCARCRSGQEEVVEIDSVEGLVRKLFELQDLNGNGFLEEDELIQLNKKIQMMYYGKGIDKREVEQRFREAFRSAFDPEGRPVPYQIFRSHMMELLGAHDRKEEGQVMMMQQFIETASTGRYAFRLPSMQSFSDAPFMAHLSMDWEEGVPVAARGMIPPPVLPAAKPSLTPIPEGDCEATTCCCKQAQDGAPSPASTMVSDGVSGGSFISNWAPCQSPSAECTSDVEMSHPKMTAPPVEAVALGEEKEGVAAWPEALAADAAAAAPRLPSTTSSDLAFLQAPLAAAVASRGDDGI